MFRQLTDEYGAELLLEVVQVVVAMWTSFGEELEPRSALVAGRQHALCTCSQHPHTRCYFSVRSKADRDVGSTKQQ